VLQRSVSCARDLGDVTMSQALRGIGKIPESRRLDRQGGGGRLE
jgi:hypothetical protein